MPIKSKIKVVEATIFVANGNDDRELANHQYELSWIYAVGELEKFYGTDLLCSPTRLHSYEEWKAIFGEAITEPTLYVAPALAWIPEVDDNIQAICYILAKPGQPNCWPIYEGRIVLVSDLKAHKEILTQAMKGKFL